MLLSNEAELLAMEAEKYSGLNPIVVDNNNLTIGLDSGFLDAVSSISGAISGLDNKLDISAFTGYSAGLDSGLSNAFETVHNEITELQGDTSYLSGSIDYLSGVVTTGLSAYSAGPNINITDYVISGKDWLDTIQEASANAYNEATALIPPAFDPTFMSGAIDNKLDTTAFSTVSGDFATTGDLQNYATTSWVSNINTAIRNDMGTIATNTANNYSAITSTSSFLSGAVDNKLDTTAFSDVSSTFLTAHQSLADYATTAWVDSQGYLTAHQPISADEWNNVYDTVNVYSGSWTGSETSPTANVDSHGSIYIVSSNNTVYFDVNGTWFNDAVNSAYTGSQGDANVNVYVHNNSATIDDVNTTVQTNSASWSTSSTYTGDVQGALNEVYSNSGYWNDVYTTVYNNSGSWTGGSGGSIDTIPFIVQSPLTTGISGYSAYIGLDGEAFESSAYVPFSALDGSYDGDVHTINGSGLHANMADYAYYDSNGDIIANTTNYATEAYNTVQSNSANWGGGSTPVSGLELSAGEYITIVDDIPNSASIISVTGLATTGDLNYVSGVVGNVESLLAQL